MKHNKKTIKNSILGFIIGNVLGTTMELKNKDTKTSAKQLKKILYTPDISNVFLSDETSLMLCLMDTMTNGYCKYNYCRNVVKWFNEGGFPSIKCNVLFSKNNNKIIYRDNRNSYYNECIMRCMPLIFENQTQINFDVLKEICHLTHEDYLTDIATYFYIYFGKLLYMNKYLTIKEAYINAIIDVCTLFSNEDTAIEMFDCLLKNIQTVSRCEIKNTGSTIDTLVAVFWCLLTTNSYKESILKAISLDGDTSTICALVGGISGLYYSNKTILKHFVLPLNLTFMVCKKIELISVINEFTNKLSINSEDDNTLGNSNLNDRSR